MAGARDQRLWWTLAAGGVLLRIGIMPHGGFPTDISTFKAWAVGLAERGPGLFYGSGFADYLPGYLYVLWLIGEISQAVRLNDVAFLFALKLPAAAADVAVARLVYTISGRAAPGLALALSASYLFSPGIVFNSAYWGQVDSVGVMLAMAGLALVLGAKGPLASSLAAAVFALGMLVKPQTGPAALAAAAFLLRAPSGGGGRAGIRWELPAALAAAAGTAALVAMPFGLGPGRLAGLLASAAGVYPYGSVMAFNLWGAVQGFWKSDAERLLGVPIGAIGAALTLAAVAAAISKVWRGPTAATLIAASAVSLLAAFALPTRIHERYLLFAIPFLAAAVAFDRRVAWPYGILSAILALNLLFAYTRPHLGTFSLPGWLEGTLFSPTGTRWLGALTVACLAATLAFLFTRDRPGSMAGARSRSQTTSA